MKKEKMKKEDKWLESAIMSLVKARLLDKISSWRFSYLQKALVQNSLLP
jgi:hypothetical protein